MLRRIFWGAARPLTAAAGATSGPRAPSTRRSVASTQPATCALPAAGDPSCPSSQRSEVHPPTVPTRFNLGCVRQERAWGWEPSNLELDTGGRLPPKVLVWGLGGPQRREDRSSSCHRITKTRSSTGRPNSNTAGLTGEISKLIHTLETRELFIFIITVYILSRFAAPVRSQFGWPFPY